MSVTVYPSKTLGHAMTHRGGEVSCRGCRKWFSTELGVCPECGWGRPQFNKWLRTSQLNNQLTGQVAKNHENTSFIKKAKSERQPR
jgi:rRNA maturation endonuclease Nob1